LHHIHWHQCPHYLGSKASWLTATATTGPRLQNAEVEDCF